MMKFALVENLIGSHVEKVERSDSGALVLHFPKASKPLQIPTPWSFTSCLASLSSDDCRGEGDITADLTGLEGAQLSGFNSDGVQLDIRFGSITINTTVKARTDLSGRDDIVRLVDNFYEKIRTDSELGPVFDEVAQVDWETHLPKMYDFWDTVLFRSGTFRGDPIGAHAKLVSHTEMSMARFEHWLVLFRSSVAELFEGENADHIVRCAEDMANVLYSKINGVPDLRFSA